MRSWLWLAALLHLSGCSLIAHKIDVPDLEFMKEIPFEDGAEAVEVHSINIEENKILNPIEWAEFKEKGEYVIIPYSTWTKLKIFTLDTCNKFKASCKQQVDTIHEALMSLDKIIKKMKGN